MHADFEISFKRYNNCYRLYTNYRLYTEQTQVGSACFDARRKNFDECNWPRKRSCDLIEFSILNDRRRRRSSVRDENDAAHYRRLVPRSILVPLRHIALFYVRVPRDLQPSASIPPIARSWMVDPSLPLIARDILEHQASLMPRDVRKPKDFTIKADSSILRVVRFVRMRRNYD